MNCNHFQLAMLAYNLNCWLMLFNREEEAKVDTLQHTTLATARLKFLFLAAKIWRHAGRVGVSYSDHYAEQGLFERLMNRLRTDRCDRERLRTRDCCRPTLLRLCIRFYAQVIEGHNQWFTETEETAGI